MARRTPRSTRKSAFTPKSKRVNRTHVRPLPARTIVTRSQRSVDGNFLQRLPSEVFGMILDKMSVLEISVFSMVSKELTSCVVDYISTLAWKKKTIFGSFHPSTLVEERSTNAHFRDLGLLFKRCTLLLPTRERLKFVFTNFSQIPCVMVDQCLSRECIGFSIYGVFLQTLIAGWDEMECHRVFSFLCDLTNLLQKIEVVVTGKPGVKWYQELQVRLFCRQVLLDPWPNQPETQFWLTLLLKPWPMVSQAHLLFILYGPLLPEGTLGWLDVVERGVPYKALWDLARAILLIVDKVKDQANHSMLTILEELIAIPQPWHVENVARLMVLCGTNVCYTFIASKAVNGRLLEISRLIVYIVLLNTYIRGQRGQSDRSLFLSVSDFQNGKVCERDGYHMSWAVKLVEHICKVVNTASEKHRFIQQLENAFSRVSREMLEFSVAGNHFDDLENFQNLLVLLNSTASFHSKFLNMLLKLE